MAAPVQVLCALGCSVRTLTGFDRVPEALARPEVNVVVLPGAIQPHGAHEWRLCDMRRSAALDVVTTAVGRERLLRDFAPPLVDEYHAHSMHRLVKHFAMAAQCAPCAGADEALRVEARLLVTDASAIRCPRYHEDKVMLRMVSAFAGKGTVWLPEAPGRRPAMVLASRLSKSTPAINRAAAPAWLPPAEGAATGDVLFLKGSGWEGSRAVIHRSPAPLQATGAARALFSCDLLRPNS